MSNTKANTRKPEENLIRYGQLEDELGGSIKTAERRLSQVRKSTIVRKSNNCQAIHANRLKHKELQRFDKEYDDLDKLLEDLPKKLSHKIMVSVEFNFNLHTNIYRGWSGVDFIFANYYKILFLQTN